MKKEAERSEQRQNMRVDVDRDILLSTFPRAYYEQILQLLTKFT